MALRTVCAATFRTGTDLGVNNARTFVTTAFLSRRIPPLGPMPNEEIDVENLESLEKYRSYTRYFKQAEEARNKPAWWKTYRGYIPLDKVQETWAKSSGPFHIKRLADHYGVFRDLFPMAYFLPQVSLRIGYGQDNNGQVHYGNRLTPTIAASVPQISFDAEEGSLWTLLLTCPGNIPGGAVQAGEELCHYLPPFPARGTGFHRYIYVLFQQEGPINFQEDVRPSPCHSLVDRSFKTIEFYRKHQDNMTPAGLAFFQSQWDESVTDTFHTTLDMREPVFEFIRPPVYHPPQVKYPHRQPLRYLDRYRDGKEHTYGIY
ncbi:hypothetical protein FQN60_002679 [Etheostoma spectabile]|uniref:Large ribosomal subunit protein mL38 n=1 Tax=Etheostoma spectabile TaxID=54343 RepID=A0A5J5CH22_9PERO|nr:hypothetical protein FQN60_002679 [Etheostoma spectabile]